MTRFSRGRAFGLGLSLLLVAAAPAAAGETVHLFNGRDLAGWSFFLVDESVPMQDVWSIRDGVLVCRASTLWVLVDLATRRPRRVPAAMVDCLDPLEPAAL